MAYLVPSASATDGAITDQGSNIMRLTKTGASLSAALIGEYVTIWGAPSAGNDGHRLISAGGTDYIEFTNASGVAETIADWEVVAQSIRNDWSVIETFSQQPSEAKILHSDAPLSTNQLTNAFYSLYCRRFAIPNIGARMFAPKLPNNPNFIGDSNAQSISILVRRETEGFAPRGFLIFLRHTVNSPGGQSGYWVSFNLGSGEDEIFCGNRPIASQWYPYDPSFGGPGPAVRATVSRPTGDWAAYRLIVQTESTTDVRCKVYYINGAATLNTLDAFDEPTWGSPVIEAKHINGTTVPTVITGSSTGMANWATTTPKLSGTPAWSYGDSRNGIGPVNYVDAVRIKRMP